MSVINQITGGSFEDSEGNPLASGYLIFELVSDGIVNTSTKVCKGTSIKVPLDSSGNVVTSTVYSLWPNDVMTPNTTFYYVSAFTSKGQLVWGPYAQTIKSTPSPYNIGAWIPGKL